MQDTAYARRHLLAAALWGATGAVALAVAARPLWRDPELLPNGWAFLRWRLSTAPTVDDRLDELRTTVGAAWAAHWQQLGWAPTQLALVAIKDVRVLEAYGRADAQHSWQLLAHWPVLGQSGGLGPKRREGDGQVPEGLYRIESLNPASRFDLALRISYPNARDLAEADPEARLGGDIMIHGSRTSTGCLALGNAAMASLFWLVARHAAPGSVTVLMAPRDWRRWPAPVHDARQQELARAMHAFPLPMRAG